MFFFVKSGKWGVFFCKKSGKWGCFVKMWTFPQSRVHYVQQQYFLFYILLIWGCVCTQRTPPLLTGLHVNSTSHSRGCKSLPGCTARHDGIGRHLALSLYRPTAVPAGHVSETLVTDRRTDNNYDNCKPVKQWSPSTFTLATNDLV